MVYGTKFDVLPPSPQIEDKMAVSINWGVCLMVAVLRIRAI